MSYPCLDLLVAAFFRVGPDVAPVGAWFSVVAAADCAAVGVVAALFVTAPEPVLDALLRVDFFTTPKVFSVAKFVKLFSFSRLKIPGTRMNPNPVTLNGAKLLEVRFPARVIKALIS